MDEDDFKMFQRNLEDIASDLKRIADSLERLEEDGFKTR